MGKAISVIQQVFLLIISFMAMVERPGEGEAKKAEVIAHLNEGLKDGGIVLPVWMKSALDSVLPGLINILATWVKSVGAVTKLFGKVQAVLMVVVGVMTLFDDDATNDQELNGLIHQALSEAGIVLPNWVEGALGVVVPIIVGAIKKLAGGSSLGK